MRPDRWPLGGWTVRKWKYRARQRPRAAHLRQALDDTDRYPSGYSPVTLISTRPDGPDLTGELIGWDPLADPSDCRHGCNADCLESGSDRCNFTCHADPDDLIDAWHDAEPGSDAASVELHEYLGMSREEYARWVTGR